MAKLAVLLALALAFGFLWHDRAQTEHELETLRLELEHGTKQAALKSELTSLNLSLALQEQAQHDATRIVSINERFEAALSELELSPFPADGQWLPSTDPAASGHDLPDVARAATQSSHPATSQPPDAGDLVHQAQSRAVTSERKLSACETRLLYEAREYDALATHYQTLLSIYNSTRESLHEYRESKARPQEH